MPLLPESPDPKGFKAFEYERWQSAARIYHDGLGRLTSQVAPFLLDAAGVRANTRVLDLASGPGYVAAAAAARGARVTGTDFSPEMVALARANHPGVTFETADAESLHFGAGSFEAVTMGFLLGHLGRPAVAVREAWRVLRPKGRLALSWWLPHARAVALGIVNDAVRARGKVDVGLPSAPPFELFGDPQMLRSLFVESGFGGIEVKEVPLTWKIDSAEEMFDSFLKGTARTAGLLLRQTPVSLAAIRAEVIERSRPYATPQGGLELPMPVHVVSGVKA